MSFDALKDDCLDVVLDHCDPLSMLRLCIATRWRHELLNNKVKARIGGKDTYPDPGAFRNACESIENDGHHAWRATLARLLKHEVYVYARPLDEHGKKVDEKLRLYRATVVSYSSFPYRYHKGVSVQGEYEAHNVDLTRVFVALDDASLHAYKTWMEAGSATPQDTQFDDAGSKSILGRAVDRFEPADRSKLDRLVPLFGYMDSGRCLARSSQMSVFNPHVADADDGPSSCIRKGHRDEVRA